MSIYLTLIKIDPSTLPPSLESLFFDGLGLPEVDVLGIDNFEELEDPASVSPWLAKATQGAGAGADPDSGLRYWGPFIHDPTAVAEIGDHLPSAVAFALEDLELDEAFDSVRGFYRQAAREGKAVVGGAH